MRPNSVETLQGIQGALMTYVQPEVQSDYVRTELMLINILLGNVARDLDDAAQRFVEANAALRALVGDAAEVLNSNELDGAGGLPLELETLAGETDGSVRISELSAANDRLRDAVARLGALLQGSEEPALVELRSRVIDYLQKELEPLPHNLMGARADG